MISNKHIISSGFSLVELSIVLVILGLLTGGILTGQSLIRAAELRKIVTDKDRIVAAVYTFRDQYLALPGDMPNATDFWGYTGDCAAPSASGSGTQTCNGDGDGGVAVLTDSSDYEEVFYFWKHLANAGLIEGRYSGVGSGTNSFSSGSYSNDVPNYRDADALPAAPFGYWFVGTSNESNIVLGNFAGFEFVANHGNFMSLTHVDGTSFNNYVLDLTPAEMWGMDKKIDDGKPATGKLLANRLFTCTTGSSATDASAEYALSTNSEACGPLFINVF